MRRARAEALQPPLGTAEQMSALFGVSVASPATIEARIEWPCSWLTAKMHYGGSGSQAWKGLRRTIRNITNRSGPPEPEPEQDP